MADLAVTLTVGGRVHAGWTDVAVDLALDHLSGSFQLGLTAAWLEGGKLVRQPVEVGAACSLRIGDETVITGYIDRVMPRYDHESHDLTIIGRDKAGDLIDCSAVPKEYLNQKISSIIADLCAPFGIPVRVETDIGAPLERFVANVGDSVAETIERLCKQRGVLTWSDGRGGLVIGRGVTGAPVATLSRGVNLLAAEAALTNEERFSEIIIKASQEGNDDYLEPDEIAEGEARARDKAITRYRPLIIIPETTSELVSLADRAEWEVRVRGGKSRSIMATVQGWTHGHGLWRPGQTVQIKDAWLGLGGNFLVSNVSFTLNERGRLTMLTLYPPYAFDVLPTPEVEEFDW